jgi:uncharacterized protein YbjT (DUF2867 family)
VRRIVKLSALGAEVRSSVAFWDWHGRIEEHLRASGLPAVVLLPAFNMTNLLGSAEGVRHTGHLFAPADGARIAMIHPRAVAVVAAVALTEDGHEGETYTLTGPEAITFERVAEELSAVVGRGVRFVPVPDEAARQALVESGIPNFVAGQIVTVFGFLRRGAQDRATGAVRELTGREPRGLSGLPATTPSSSGTPTTRGRSLRQERPVMPEVRDRRGTKSQISETPDLDRALWRP